MAQVTYHTLVSRAGDEDIPITAQDGRIAYALNWSATVLSLAAMTLWYLQFCSPSNRGSEGRGVAGKIPYTYQQMAEPNAEEDSRDTLHLLSKTPQTRFRGVQVSNLVSRRFIPAPRLIFMIGQYCI